MGWDIMVHMGCWCCKWDEAILGLMTECDVS